MFRPIHKTLKMYGCLDFYFLSIFILLTLFMNVYNHGKVFRWWLRVKAKCHLFTYYTIPNFCSTRWIAFLSGKHICKHWPRNKIDELPECDSHKWGEIIGTRENGTFLPFSRQVVVAETSTDNVAGQCPSCWREPDHMLFISGNP